MAIDPVLKMFWILIAAILGTNAAWLLYVSLIEDEIAIMYKATSSPKKKVFVKTSLLL